MMWLGGFVVLLFGVEFINGQYLSLPEYLQYEYQRAFTAYGPGLAVFTPYSYVDMFYDNIPFIGKIPLIGKDGTSSRTGTGVFYPIGGNPSNPIPPVYRARPLPIHAPNPVEVVAVPLDEEALHGEPLFPKELVLPEAMEMAVPKGHTKEKGIPENPFGSVGPISDPFSGTSGGNAESLSDLDTDLEKAIQTMKIGEIPNQSGNKQDQFGEIISPGAVKAITSNLPVGTIKTKRPVIEDDSDEYETDDDIIIRRVVGRKLNVLQTRLKL